MHLMMRILLQAPAPMSNPKSRRSVLKRCVALCFSVSHAVPPESSLYLTLHVACAACPAPMHPRERACPLPCTARALTLQEPPAPLEQVHGAPRHQHAPGWSAVQDKVVKQAARQAYQAAVEDVERTASQRREGKGSAADRTAGLRPKLQRAIEAMQSGLVERDTEVGEGWWKTAALAATFDASCIC